MDDYGTDGQLHSSCAVVGNSGALLRSTKVSVSFIRHTFDTLIEIVVLARSPSLGQ